MDRADVQAQLTLIPGVLGANFTWGPDETLTEVHILADQSRRAREVMLDVKSLLSVVLQQQIDFRIISVAQVDTSKVDDDDDLAKVPRLHLTAAYMRRLPSTGVEAVVELRIGDEDIVGRSRAAHPGESVCDAVSRAFQEALKDLLPGRSVRPRVQFTSGYCIADIQLFSPSSGDAEEYVGAVRTTGDQPWDVCRAILASLNRRLEVLLQTATA